MNSSESAAHAELTTYLVYGSIVMVLIMGGFIWWLNYSYKKRNTKHQKKHLEPVSPPFMPAGQRRHKRKKNKRNL